MKQMKKIIALLLTVALTASIAISGTLAYLTQDAGTQVNTFSVGGIDVTLTEEVGVITNGGGTAEKLGTGATYEGLMPGDQIVKKVSVSNGGDDAYVRVTVTLNNALQINNAIDEVYGDANAQKMYDKIFVGWGLNHGKDLDGDGANDAGMRLTITGDDMPAHVMQVDSVKTIDEYALFYTGNWFGEQEDIVPFDGYYTTGMNPYELKYTYYMFLPEGESTVLFEGFNIPAEFDADQLKMFDGLNITIDADAIQAANIPGAVEGVEQKDNIDQAKTAFRILNGEVADEWDGTADTSWYNDTDTEFTLSTAEALAGLSELVDGGNNFAGKTIKLASDIDLYAEDADGNRINFDPIGHSSNGQVFKGTFDGQGHAIQNMYIQNDLGAWQYEGEYYALFAYTDGAEIKNVTVADAYISSGRNEAAAVVGNAVDTKFSDISINSVTLIAYNNSAGGVAAECYGDCSFTNVTVDENTVIGPLWGTYDVRLGGVVGMVKSSDKVSFSNITVACQLDAINDVASNYQWYNYRYSGMLIGQVDGVDGVADPTGYVTCENVTVIYDDWVNYHYCEDSSYGTPSYASAGQYKFNRVEAGTGTNGIDLSTCDHDETETHNLLIVFDQLFGGGQGVSGLKTYDGVTVVYN